MYGLWMARLTEQNWLDHGLKTLARSGYTALKAASMVDALNVSRGSFYWHFKDISDFKIKLLQHWQAKTTATIIKDMETQPAGSDKLADLMIRAHHTKPQLDRAVRAWASHDETARAALVEVDEIRIRFIQDLLLAAGVEATEAMPRARFLYAASLGEPTIAPTGEPDLDSSALKHLAQLFMRTP